MKLQVYFRIYGYAYPCISYYFKYLKVHKDTAIISDTVSIGNFVTVSENAVIEDEVVLMPGVFIGEGCRIGKGSVIYANVSIYDSVNIGEECILHSGVVVGSDGLGFAKDNHSWIKIEHLGKVIIGANVEIGSNSTIDRGSIGNTLI